MSSYLTNVAEAWAIHPALRNLAFTALLTLLVLFAQAVAGWFDERNP